MQFADSLMYHSHNSTFWSPVAVLLPGLVVNKIHCPRDLADGELLLKKQLGVISASKSAVKYHKNSRTSLFGTACVSTNHPAQVLEGTPCNLRGSDQRANRGPGKALIVLIIRQGVIAFRVM